jgi:cell division protein FtsB
VTRWRWLALVVLVLAAIWAWRGATYSQGEYRRLLAQERLLRERIDSIRGDVDSMRAFNDSLGSSAVVQERMARERLGMIRPGEILILLVPDSAPPTPARE